jgi:hypothetical protein
LSGTAIERSALLFSTRITGSIVGRRKTFAQALSSVGRRSFHNQAFAALSQTAVGPTQADRGGLGTRPPANVKLVIGSDGNPLRASTRSDAGIFLLRRGSLIKDTRRRVFALRTIAFGARGTPAMVVGVGGRRPGSSLNVSVAERPLLARG